MEALLSALETNEKANSSQFKTAMNMHNTVLNMKREIDEEKNAGATVEEIVEKPKEEEQKKDPVKSVTVTTHANNMEFKAKPRTKAQVMEMMKRIRPSETFVDVCDGPVDDIGPSTTAPPKKQEGESVEPAITEEWKWNDRTTPAAIEPASQDEAAEEKAIEHKSSDDQAADVKMPDGQQYTAQSIGPET